MEELQEFSTMITAVYKREENVGRDCKGRGGGTTVHILAIHQP
jgi:hypothetical protein